MQFQSDILEKALQAEIGHDGGNDAAAGQLAAVIPGFGDDAHDLVAIHHRAVLVHDHDAVGVAVKRDADIGAHFMNLFRQAHGMGRAAFGVDVEAIGLVVDGDDFRTQFPQRGGRHLVTGAIGAVDHDAQA